MDDSTPSSSKIGISRSVRNKESLVTITENVSLTQDQHQALKIVCDIYQQSFSEYIHEALVQTMRSDIEDGNLSVAMLDRLDEGSGEGEGEKSTTREKNVDIHEPASFLDELTRLNQLSKPEIPKNMR